jgi:tetratricopeptide (TPR) repeat protein
VRHLHRIVPLLLLCVVGCARPKSHGPPPTTVPALSRPDPSIVEEENRGVGQMGRYDFDAAIDVFSELVAKHPELIDDRVNLAIATLNRQREGDSAAAMEMLHRVLSQRPSHVRARYCRGLLLLNAGKPAEALTDFQSVVLADSTDAYAVYYVGRCLAATGKPAEALQAFEWAANLDPYLRSAYYGAFQAHQQLRQAEQAKAELAEFQRLKNDLRARLVEFKYTRMGPKAEATVSPLFAQAQPPAPRHGPVFAEPVPLPLVNGEGVRWVVGARSNMTAADIDGDGRVDLFITRAVERDGKLLNAVLLQRDDHRFELQLDHPLAQVGDVNAALWGDFDNDGLTDVYLCRHGANQLWRQTARSAWQDVTNSTKTAGDASLETIDGAFVDLDHDGDLDLFLVRKNGPNELLNNDGDGSFRSIAGVAGVVGGGGGEVVGLWVNDFDGDGDADVAVLKRQPPHEVFINDRQWHYHAGDATLLGAEVGGPFTLADVDGTGRLQKLIGDAHGISVEGSASIFNDPAIAFLPVVLDNGSGPSIVVLEQGGGPPVLLSSGPGRWPFATVSLSGKSNLADQMRSNASGIGVKLAARIGPRWVALDTYRAGTGPGQSLQPIAIGLGGASKIDFLKLLWPDGLRQTELDQHAGQHYAIAETQRQTSSCPVIFAWDGTKFAFVTDCLGVGGIGFATGKPGEYVEPRPWENVLVPENLLNPRDGGMIVKLTEPMDEACYLDSMSLIAYDLPPGWSMTLDERMNVNGPPPTGAPRFYRRQMLPTRATNDRGEDVTAAITSADGRAAPTPPSDPRFIGFLSREHAIELTFDRPIDGGGDGEPMLIADGWIEYPYSQTMFAAWQAHAPYEAPTLEACGPDGRWVTVLEQFGYPAGMPRQMSVPIPRDKLPRGARRLRLRTTQEIYWDRLAMAWAEDCPQARRTVLPLRRAKLDDVGYPARSTREQRRPDYDYSRRTPLWDVAHQDGFYTALGPVEELVRSTDDAVTVFGPGEEVHAEFAAPSTEVPAGWTRRYVLELAGWCKDRDLYTQDGETIEPLPHRAMSRDALRRRDELHRRFNTRYRSGE